jgi:hypothetical protein
VTLCPRDPVELRLTANLQLRPCHNPRSASWTEARSSPLSDTARYWYESLDRKLSRAVTPARGLVGHARACSPTSDAFAATTPLDPAFRLDPRWPPLGSASAAISSKTAAPAKPGRLPSTGALSSAPRLRPLLAQTPNTNREITESLPPYLRLARAGFGHRFHPSAPCETRVTGSRVNRTAISARLPEAGAERVSPIDFCNRNSPRAQPRTNRSPVETFLISTRRVQLALDSEASLLAGLGPRPPRRSPIPGGAMVSTPASTLRPRQRLLPGTS